VTLSGTEQLGGLVAGEQERVRVGRASRVFHHPVGADRARLTASAQARSRTPTSLQWLVL
jgi:hypothetical protein